MNEETDVFLVDAQAADEISTNTTMATNGTNVGTSVATPDESIAIDELEPFIEKEEVMYEDVVNHSVYQSVDDVKVVSVKQILSLMKQGYTRTHTTKGYDETIGSIQGYYNLNDEQIKVLFADPRLKHSRTSFAKRAEKTLIIED